MFLRGPLLFSRRAGPPSSYTVKYFVLRDLEGTLAILDYASNKPGQVHLYTQLFGSRVTEVKEGEQEGFYPFVVETADGKVLCVAGRTVQERGSWVTAFREAIVVAPEQSEEERNKEIERLITQEKKHKSKFREMVLLLLGPGD